MAVLKRNKKEDKAVIYRYLYNGKVVYVGKTIRSLQQIVEEHCRDLKFYGIVEVEFYETTQRKDICKHEAFWINYYKPVLNEYIPGEHCALSHKPRNKWRKYPYKIEYKTPITLLKNF